MYLFSITCTLLIISLVIFDIKAAQITKLSDNNPKVKTIKKLNRLTIFIVIIAYGSTLLSPLKNSLDTKTTEILLIGLCSLFIMYFGNLSPKIPFNRYLGLRLPWTIRDEDTWKLAHKILGYISFPIAILMLISAFYFKVETVATVAILTWIMIPGLYSLSFYKKKFKNVI